jgi:hypothetical protein
MLFAESRFVFRLGECVGNGFEPLVVGDIFDKRLDLPEPSFHPFQVIAGTRKRRMNICNLGFEIRVFAADYSL